MSNQSDDARDLDDSELQQLADRYVALWNEPDAAVRRSLLRELWAPNGAQVLVDPPQEVREAAARLRFPIPPLEVHGYEALEARVTRAYETFVAAGDYVFESRDDAAHLLDNVVTLGWVMVPATGGEPAGGGVDVLALDPDGRIRTDYLFIGT
jgi:hypothetical protein